MKRLLTIIGVVLAALYCGAQTRTETLNRSDEARADQTILTEGDVAALSLAQAEQTQLTSDPNFVPPEPTEKEKVTDPGVVIFRNADGEDVYQLDWTIGQHARGLLEHLRLSIYRYQAGKPNPGGVIGVTQAVTVWPKLRRMFCREYPGGRYIDLQGQVQFCEEKHEDANTR